MILLIGAARCHGRQCQLLLIDRVETVEHTVPCREHRPDQNKTLSTAVSFDWPLRYAD